MTASTMRRRVWEFPDVFTYYERIQDGKVFQVRQRYQRDMQVRLESADGEVKHPFLSNLESDYRHVHIGGER